MLSLTGWLALSLLLLPFNAVTPNGMDLVVAVAIAGVRQKKTKKKFFRNPDVFIKIYIAGNMFMTGCRRIVDLYFMNITGIVY